MPNSEAAARRLPIALQPLATPIFRSIWIAAMASNVGTWMQNVGAAWMMATLSASPLLIALVQTATTLPIFLLAGPAGAIADIVDRRKLLLITQGWMLGAAAVLGMLTIAGETGPVTLLLLTFALGLGGAMNAPAWQATVPQLVPRDQLASAIALNSVQFNIARAIGPAIGGLLISIWNPGIAFVLNAVSFLGVMFVLWAWKGEPKKDHNVGESVVSAMWAGFRYVRHSPELHSVLVRTGVFVIAASALWALLPVVAKQDLGSSSSGYGILLGCLGVGSVIGAGFFSRLRGSYNADATVLVFTILFSAATFALGYVSRFGLLALAMLAGGIAWMSVMSTFNVSAQIALPAWVRARALSVYILVFQGAQAVGSWMWGQIASRAGSRIALYVSAASLIAGLIVAMRFRLREVKERDLTPAMHWPEPAGMTGLDPEQGPVLIQVEYHVDEEHSREFLDLLQELERIRRRDGALRWAVFMDPAHPRKYVETFLVESWAEHLRQHERMTVADQELQDRVNAFHTGDHPPVATHLLSALSRSGAHNHDR
jgi:MFS family permease/quinol monooxygenase YgiN